MSFTLQPAYESILRRYEAFLHGATLDRPLVSITLPVEHPLPVPQKKYATLRDRWLDVDFRAQCMDITLRNTRFLGDAVPVAWPNLGPEIFSAWCGCGYEFGEDTTWSQPCLSDWADMDRCRLDMAHPLLKKLTEFTDALLERAGHDYVVGLTDFHAGGDHLAALRDPQTLCFDMVEHVPEIKAALKLAQEDYFTVYTLFYEKLRARGMPAASWIPLPYEGRFYIPSNDFSCMISNAAFEDVFLPGIRAECDFYDASIYHLDGPGALRHLDSLLAIDRLGAVQWVPGAGHEEFAQWIPVYRRIQQAGKGIYLGIQLSELEQVIEALRPEGIWFAWIGGIDNEETARRVISRIARW